MCMILGVYQAELTPLFSKFKVKRVKIAYRRVGTSSLHAALESVSTRASVKIISYNVFFRKKCASTFCSQSNGVKNI